MMKKSLYILTTIILMIASFIYGARFGAEIFITSNAKFQAGLATANLIRLDRNDIEGVRSALTYDLDRNLLFHGKSEQSIFRYIWPEFQIENEKRALRAIQVAAKYKQEHYAPFVKEEYLQGLSEYEMNSLKQDGEMIDRVMNKYAR